ncbi:nickel pincer cofactor biosynthesis protein LarC [Maridesulfovibrio bastinii]|uniref:nickel pincer cofactor biosynthesis protein LarC n=1 Tax=Maridesulfovibrio bastinii TaxID=47157 RepID=UPI0004120FE8|nr:nickel pincer cofactor biosynthesis protein LarC [Maridesulfovibrio bastinii]
MKVLYYDCFAGISGDMNLAAMINLGVDADFLKTELDKLGLQDEFELIVSSDSRNGIHGTKVDVVLKNQDCGHHHHHIHADNNASKASNSAKGHHHSGHGHDHSHGEHEHSHAPNRNFSDIREIINKSTLSKEVKDTSISIFEKVAVAEAAVHGKTIDEVHFHEVGATDSIVDIVGAAICFHKLGVDAVWGSPVELGGGFVRCAHGVMPVPAPATAEILKNVPSRRGASDHEATTPTGAAIIKTLVSSFPSSPVMEITETGYGIGHRKTEFPNFLRVFLAESQDSADGNISSKACLLQCNIDDMTAEMLGAALETLMEKGAMDVYFTPVTMKKNRPGTMLSVLCSEDDKEHFTRLLFYHTTTLGVKCFPLDKTALERKFETVQTDLGPVTFKHALIDGEIYRSKPEFEDCRKIAREKDISLSRVYEIINKKSV